MPRTARRTQPVLAPQDQGYGVAGEQMAAQHAIPLPDNRSAPIPAATAQVSPPSPAVAAGPPQDPITAALAMRPPGAGMAEPSARPDEPITAGMSVGAGPGPEALGGNTNPVADLLRQVADATGDPGLARLAAKARSGT